MTPEALAALHKRCFVTPRPWAAAEFALYDSDPLVFLLIEADAGFLLGRAVAGEAEVLTLAVSPESRRLGLGTKLLARFTYQARLRGAQTAFLEVSAANAPAVALYESAGFSTTGRRKGYYTGPDGVRIDALVMARAL
jgi:ribosomal-protein-alanine N-acetyltransferase